MHESIKLGIVRSPIIIQLMTGGQLGSRARARGQLLPAAPSWSRSWTMMIIIMMTIDYLLTILKRYGLLCFYPSLRPIIRRILDSLYGAFRRCSRVRL